MKLLNNKFFPLIFSVILVLIFFWQFFFKGLLPIPADTIVGLYHPFRDLYAKEYPRGVPFKNSLITDPVRQQYPWKKLIIDQLKKGELPIWNPYEMAGKPLLANFQSGAFYPFNLIFLILPFNLAWSLYIVFQPLLAMLFNYLFLRNLKLSKLSSLFGGFVFGFCGFSIAWLEWGNIGHTALWLPLVLLSIDKILVISKLKVKSSKFIWPFIFVLSLTSSFFAGHLQIFFYIFVTSLVYLLFRWIAQGRHVNILVQFIIYYTLFVIITSVQWIPTLQFINESARNLDLTPLSEGWFIPWQHLIQFIAPDFFGNPTTLNYWGTWNYGEFIGFVGIFPLIIAIFALLRKNRNVFFFGSVFLLSLMFALPTFLAKIPYILNVPLLSTAQPTRLIILADFSLSVLAAFGLDKLTKEKKSLSTPFILIGGIIFLLWLIVLRSHESNFLVSRQNLIFPTLIFAISLATILASRIKFEKYLPLVLFIVTVFDLFRFGWKFTPFTKPEYLFPESKVLRYLKDQGNNIRVMTTDSRILPPNIASVYGIQSVDGYDPLYLRGYGELIAASERGKPDIAPPFGFNRIITPHNFDTRIIDILNVRYVLALYDNSSSKLTKVLEEGQTKLYENRNFLPRVFFVKRTNISIDKRNSIDKIFNEDLRNVAVVEGLKKDMNWSSGIIKITEERDNYFKFSSNNDGEGFLVLTDSFYPTWHAKIDGLETKIYKTDYNFRGIIIPKGKHIIEFYITLF